MRRRSIPVIVYAVTALIELPYFDALYAGEPIYRPRIAHLGLAGAVLFALSSVVSLFSFRYGIVCGLIACCLSGPLFLGELSAVPFRDLLSALGYSPWEETLPAMVLVAISTCYSVWQMYLLHRAPAAFVKQGD